MFVSVDAVEILWCECESEGEEGEEGEEWK